MLSYPASLILPLHGVKQRFREENFFGKSLPEPRRRREGCRMNLLETLALLTFILGLLGLIVDVVRLTIEVMEKTSQKKNDDNKKD